MGLECLVFFTTLIIPLSEGGLVVRAGTLVGTHGKKGPQLFSHCGSSDCPGMQSLND